MTILKASIFLCFCISEVVAFAACPLTSLQMQLNKNPTTIRRNFLLKSATILPLLPLIPKNAKAFTPDEVNQIKIYDTTYKSVCYIVTDYNVTQNPNGIGSGFIYDKPTQDTAHIVTNFHVINYAKNATVKLLNNDGNIREYIPTVTGYDIDKDIAVLLIKTQPSDNLNLQPIKMSSDKDIKIGQNCYAIGAPLAKEWSFTSGIVSGKGRELTSPSGRKISNVIQSDTPINKGSSGGCLLNSDGELIGINTAILGGDVSTGISLSISVDTLKTTVANILENGIIEHPTLGITYLERLPTEQEALQSGVPYVPNGVVILELSPLASPLLKAAKKQFNNKYIYGDIIVGINDCDINVPQDMIAILEHHKPGDKIKLRLLRGNELEHVTVEVELGSDKDVNLALRQSH